MSEPIQKERVMKLHQDFIAGNISEEQMSTEEVDAVKTLYIQQISEVKDKIDNTKIKIYKSLMNDKPFIETLNKFRNGEIKDEELTDEQTKNIDLVYDVEYMLNNKN